ncbi:hypothetical protein BGZ76_010279 [Entomortierella beljakovae]|nr:hypothetical protein BGZ76_010279 [Entomortierella beljakovae]
MTIWVEPTRDKRNVFVFVQFQGNQVAFGAFSLGMRAGIIFLLYILWLLSGDEGPNTDYLQKRLLEIREESSAAENRTFGVNNTNPTPVTVLTELTKLFNPEGRDPRSHYYQNVTGSFKGDWVFDEEIASNVNKEIPLPSAPQNETITDGGSGGENSTETSKDEGKDNDDKESSDRENNEDKDDDNEEDDKPIDTIEDKKAQYLEDIDKFRGPFQFNRSGSFVFNIKETKATEYVNWVKGSWRLRHEDNEDYGISLSVQGVHFESDAIMAYFRIDAQQ